MILLYAGIAMVVGLGFGLALFPWAMSPMPGPGFKYAGGMFARIFHTIAQVIRGEGVLVKRNDNTYEIGQYDDDRGQVRVSDTWLDIDADKTRWGLFGKRPFGLTWEQGTDLHERVQREDSDDPHDINMGAVHRFLQGTNEAEDLHRAEDKAEAEYSGGSQGLSQLMMAVLIMFMVLMGAITTWFML